MCWVLYLAADRPLTERLFDPESPAFNVASVSGNETSVRKQFSKAFVYALGAHTGCGCGFDREQANADHPEELAAAEVSLEALRRYLGDALESTGPLELFACWDGDQVQTPDHRWKWRLADITTEMTWFPDRTFVEVVEA
jgi:hypothetical protein